MYTSQLSAASAPSVSVKFIARVVEAAVFQGFCNVITSSNAFAAAVKPTTSNMWSPTRFPLFKVGVLTSNSCLLAKAL